MLFYERNTVGESLNMSADEFVVVGKSYYTTHNYYENGEIRPELSYTTSSNAAFKQAERQEILANIDGDAVFTFDYNNMGGYGGTAFEIKNARNPKNDVYSTGLSGFGVAAQGSVYRSDRILWGTYPQNSDEIMISLYTYLSLKDAGSVSMTDEYGNVSEVTVQDYSDLKNITLNVIGRNGWTSGAEYKVTGVYECDEIPSEITSDGTLGSQALYEWQQRVANGFYSYCLVSESFYDANIKYFGSVQSYIGECFDQMDQGQQLMSLDKEISTIYQAATLPPRKGLMAIKVYNAQGEAITSLSENGMAVDAYAYYSIISSAVISHMEGKFYSDYETMYEEWSKAYEALGVFSDGIYSNGGDVIYLTDTERIEKLSEAIAFIDKYEIPVFENITLVSTDKETGIPIQIEGFYLNNNYSGAYFGEQIYETLEISLGSYMMDETDYDATGDIYNKFIVAKQGLDLDKVLDRVYITADDDSFYSIKNDCVTQVQYYVSLIDILSKVFLYVGIAFAVFSMLLLFNFISVSIAGKKKEIGILRAVGARSADVFKIFYSESAIITVVCLVLSIVVSSILCAVFNGMIASELGVPLALFVFGPLSVALMTGIAIVTSVISTFMPVYTIAKKRPVESIRAL